MDFPVDWGRKCPLTIQSSQVDETLTSFPVLFTVDNLPSEMFDADGSNPALNGGGDIRFSSDADGNTRIPCEVVSFITNNTPANGSAEIWVKVPSVSASTDTTIYVWYNKTGESQPAANDTYGSQNVWDSNYKAVYHFFGNSNDSTASGFNGTDSNVSYTNSYATFNGSSSKITTGNIGIGGASARTYFARAYVDSTSSSQANLFGHGTESASTSDHLYVYLPWGSPWSDGPGFYNGHYSNDWYTASNQYSYNEFTNLVTSYNGGAPSSSAKIFINGASKTVTGASSTTLNTNDSNYGIGYQRATNNNYFKGRIDELRFSNTQRSNGWVAVESLSLSAPATLIVDGTPETPGGAIDLDVNKSDTQTNIEFTDVIIDNTRDSNNYDTQSITESIITALDNNNIDISSSVTLTDVISNIIIETFINNYDNVNITDVITILNELSTINVSDIQNIVENITMDTSLADINPTLLNKKTVKIW